MKNQNNIAKTKIPDVKKIIMVTSGKGGVGKSTVASGLALTLVREGYSVGLLDADIFGPSIPTLFKIKDDDRPALTEKNGRQLMEPFNRLGLKIMSIGFFFDEKQAVVWRGPMVTNAIKQLLTETDWGLLDYLIIDTPPGTGDVLITLLQSFYISGAIVVTTPQKISIADVQKTVNMLQDQQIGIPILGIVENMSWFTPTKHPDEKYLIFGEGGAQRLSDIFNIPVLTQIPVNELICKGCDNGNLSSLLDEQNIEFAFKQLTYTVINQKKEYRYLNNK